MGHIRVEGLLAGTHKCQKEKNVLNYSCFCFFLILVSLDMAWRGSFTDFTVNPSAQGGSDSTKIADLAPGKPTNVSMWNIRLSSRLYPHVLPETWHH